jgi:asparagine synthase (glutamine-hydrolysing)
LKSSGFNDLHDSIFDAMDQPSIDGMNSYLVSKVVAERGIKVALSGLGGDELLAGYSTFESVPRLVRYFAPFRTVKGLGRGFRIVSAPLFKCLTSPKYAGLFEYGTDIGSAFTARSRRAYPTRLAAEPAPPRQVRILDTNQGVAKPEVGSKSARSLGVKIIAFMGPDGNGRI